MKNKYINTNKVRLSRKYILLIALALLIIVIINPLLFGMLPLPNAIQNVIAQYNVVYTKDFSREKYMLIKSGMTKKEVIALIGVPFGGMPEEPFCESWSIAKPEKYLRFPPFAEDLYWLKTAVCFDPKTSLVTYPQVEHVFYN